MANEHVLIVDDEESLRRVLGILLKKEGYEVTAVANASDALAAFQKHAYDVVLTDIKMPGMSGIDLLRALRAHDPAVPVIVMTAYASLDTAIEAVNQGAHHYFIKQAKNEEIKLVVKRALEMRRLRNENKVLKYELRRSQGARKIIGKSDRIQAVFETVRKVARSESTVLLCGESGTGKELFAREIHTASRRADGPFVSINCGALPENLLESELFGHVKGSFTGAIRDKEGLFTVASGGTFLLDEVGETSLAIQVKLLRVLQEREVIPVGGEKPAKVDVRLVAATNADLEREVERGAFRADLFYRLNVIPIVLPPLRERREDIPLLVDHFLRESCRCAERSLLPMDEEALAALTRYDWPGNVRELENVIERAVILEEGDHIGIEAFPERIATGKRPSWATGNGVGGGGFGGGLSGGGGWGGGNAGNGGARNADGRDAAGTLEDIERDYLVKVLEDTGWQKKKASAILGINSSTLYRKIQRYGLEPKTAGVSPIEDDGEE